MIGIKPEVRPIETVTPIKPSEAIRLGCLLAPVQTFGSFGGGDRTCVVGAMLRGYGEDWNTPAITNQVRSRLGPVAVLADCPACLIEPVPRGQFHGTVFHLNDDHRWPRERIADWLESIGL